MENILDYKNSNTEFIILDNAKPEVKYFLIKIIHCYGVDTPVDQPQVELAIELGVSRNVVGTALKYLADGQYLEQERFVDKGGASKGRYRVSGKLQQKLRNAADHEVFHGPLIDHLLEPDVSRKKINKRHQLMLSHRLLLIVLLGKANRRGVVEGMGMSELGGLTGMSGERLRSQISKLKDLGYLRFHVPGATGKRLFGHIPGMFFLNLSHDSYGCVAYSSHIYIYTNGRHLEGKVGGEANFIAAEAESLKRERGPSNGGYKVDEIVKWIDHCFDCSSKFERVADFFIYEKEPRAKKLLQVKLEQYASYFLSYHWDSLKEESISTEFISENPLLALLENELLPPVYKKNTDEERFPNSEEKALLSTFVFKVAWKMAVVRRDMIDSAGLNEAFHENMSCTLLPHLNQASTGFFAMEFLPEGAVKQVGEPQEVSLIPKASLKAGVEICKGDAIFRGLSYSPPSSKPDVDWGNIGKSR